jgi:hypothetical protein
MKRLFFILIIMSILILLGCQQPIEKEKPLSETLSQLGQCPSTCPYTISCWIPNIMSFN